MERECGGLFFFCSFCVLEDVRADKFVVRQSEWRLAVLTRLYSASPIPKEMALLGMTALFVKPPRRRSP